MGDSAFFEGRRFRRLDRALTREMYEVARGPLVERIMDVFECSEGEARNWFYDSAFGLDGDTPYNYCKDGKFREVEDLLGRIEHGIFC
ncbi:DUF2384 domain-containing protein [Methanococcoides sp. SA1]|nr:DUF2384 domain-containing protein [Methanococcoides sp. SA1]